MKERINWLLGSLATIFIGLGSLYIYFNTQEISIKVFFYLLSILLTTLGVNQFIFFFESLIRKIEEPKTPFSEIFFWLIPSLFLLYQFYNVENLTLKITILIFSIILAFIFMFALAAALADSKIADKRINILVTLAILFVLVFGISYIINSTEILLFLPLIAIISYTDDVRVKFTITNGDSSRKESTNGKNKRNITHKLFPTNIGKLITKTYLLTSLLTFFLYVVIAIYAKELLPLPDTIQNFYTVVLTLYTFILSTIIAFAILILRSRINKKRTRHIRRTLLGLAQMLLVFILTSLFGLLIGIEIDGSIFTTEASPSSIFTSGKTITLLQVLVFEFVILSFPPSLMYLYATIKGFLYQEES